MVEGSVKVKVKVEVEVVRGGDGGWDGYWLGEATDSSTFDEIAWPARWLAACVTQRCNFIDSRTM